MAGYFQEENLEIDCLDKWEQTPLFLACKETDIEHKIISALISYGAKADLNLKSQFSPLDYLIRYTEDKEEVLSHLMDSLDKININYRIIEVSRESGNESYARILEGDSLRADLKNSIRDNKTQ